MSENEFDVLIVGAGLSGIGAAYHLQTRSPGRSYAILESRDAIGGTWDLFRYPGIRSDSDMYTFGYAFRPWTGGKAFADGPSIRQYVRDTASENGIDQHIHFGHRVVAVDWQSTSARWQVTAVDGAGKEQVFRARFVFLCSGYYRYEKGYLPEFAGYDDFKGEIAHPQLWDGALDYAGKRVVIIGSGATAVTLVPAMAETASHVTMLQRSPTYIASRPSIDGLAVSMSKMLPAKLAYLIARIKNIGVSILTYQLSRRWPDFVKKGVLKAVKAELGEGFDVEKHFTPNYNPWDQRFCLAPDGDVFKTL
ncbi:MAG: cation diffusion facilitator CzcD-associated flavoprotein CzcO, partial [Maricaulis maris]